MLKLNGAKVLDKAAQKEIGGGNLPIPGCTQKGYQCCQSTPFGLICDAGRCMNNHCFWY